MNEIITDLFNALTIAVIEYMDDGSFRKIGTIPDWFKQFYSDAEPEKLILGKTFPFLENFLIDAKSFWLHNSPGILKSGVWSENDISGKECNLEALAFCLKKHKILLILFAESAVYEDKKLFLQKARENNLTYDYFVKEVQKKEILIHCIVHDLVGQLTGIKYCFELLGLQNLSPKGMHYLEIGKKQSLKLEMLVDDILNAFSADVEALDAFTVDPAQAPDALICAMEVVNTLLPSFSLNKMYLQLNQNIDISADWKVVGDKSHLDRVLFNLVENALRHSPQNSTVTVNLQHDKEFILFTVDDEGSGVTEDISKNLFEKFAQGQEKAGKAGLGLYFCRATVERWGGTIGYSPRTSGGSQFWFRLPKPVLNY